MVIVNRHETSAVAITSGYMKYFAVRGMFMIEMRRRNLMKEEKGKDVCGRECLV